MTDSALRESLTKSAYDSSNEQYDQEEAVRNIHFPLFPYGQKKRSTDSQAIRLCFFPTLKALLDPGARILLRFLFLRVGLHFADQ